MNLRWLFLDFADPSLPLSFRNRMKILWHPIPVWKMPQPLRRGRIVFSLLIPAPLLLALLFYSYSSQLLHNLSLWSGLLQMLIPFTLVYWIWGCLIYGLFLRHEHYYRIRLEGFDVCLDCGYWLRGLDETIKACPECGTERKVFDEDDHLKTTS